MKANILILALILITFTGCQRMHSETGGGGKAKNQPAYEDKLQRPDPNSPGSAQ